jgi:hypothetical protein
MNVQASNKVILVSQQQFYIRLIKPVTRASESVQKRRSAA